MATAGQDVRIGIWGATGSGKTMYLVVLRDAGLKKQWQIVPADPASFQFAMESTGALERGQFQPGTGEETQYTFSMGFNVEKVIKRTWPRKSETVIVHQAFKLVVHDYPGSAFMNSTDTFDKIGDFLAGCDGILYLFDPLLEATPEGNRFYFDGPLARMHMAARASGKLESGRLPTWLAVCVTKYDEIEILDQLINGGHVIRSGGPPSNTPIVSNARGAFQQLAPESISAQLQTYFFQERIAYFGTSAIGFYARDGQRVAADDSYNLVHTLTGTRLRGPHRPINVLEPLEWLINSIYATRS